ncbi:hypothetical protein B0H10DRAFT_2208550 [Mycena sp. CBHHK59/15]|nr:hypothetical protein B0H10DRAFT_2208550 [Mycena sp. CBHHK59/15]
MLEDTISSTNLEGLLQGAGGSIADLARLLVAHLNFAVPSTDSPPSNETLLLLGGIIRSLKTINHRNEDWGSALLLQGIVPSLVHTMCSLTVPSAIEGKGGILDDCFFILAKILVVTPQHKYIAEALKAGLLQAIVLCFYYSVLSEINVELDQVRDLTQTPCFRASEIFQIWTTFVDSTETRLQVLRRYDNGNPETVSMCDRSFLWALAHYDYLTNKPSLYIQRISVMNKYPGQVLFSVLDYTTGVVNVSVRLMKAMGNDTPSF